MTWCHRQTREAGERPSRRRFALEEKGKAQKIASFAAPAEAASALPPLPPGIYSNRAAYRSPGGPITVLLLDALNTPFKDQSYARQQMLKFVQQQYRPGERMAVCTLTGQLRVLQDFTSDPQILYTILQRYWYRMEFVSAARPTAEDVGPLTAGSAAAGLDAGTTPYHHGTAGESGLRPGMDAAISAAQAAVRVSPKRLNVVFYATAYSRDGKMLANRSQKVDRVFDTGTFQQLMQPGDNAAHGY